MTSPAIKTFPLGRVVATPGARAADRALNDGAIESGGRIHSAYRTAKGGRLWVVTEGDRSSTCILLPGEY